MNTTDQPTATTRPRPVGVLLRQLADLQAHYQQQRVVLLGELAYLDPQLPGKLEAIADPVEQAVAATRALAMEDELLAVRDAAVRLLAHPEQDGGLGVPQVEVGLRLGYSRQLVFDILRRQPPREIPTEAADLVVERLTAVEDPWVRAEAAGLALATHRARKPALVRLQRAAVRRAVAGQHITQAELARRLGKKPQAITRLLGATGASARRRPGAELGLGSPPTAGGGRR
jgi:hypothetical protein